jgi:hypothetical protein
MNKENKSSTYLHERREGLKDILVWEGHTRVLDLIGKSEKE